MQSLESRTGRLVLIGGPAGAGKTTLAKAWCATRDFAAHIELDYVRSLIVSGLADPQGNDPAVGDQYALAVEACVRLASVYLAAGCDVAIDDVLEPEAFERHWQPAISGLTYTLVVLLPDLDQALRRASSRQKRVREDIIRAQHEACSAWPAAYLIDTTEATPEQTLAFALANRLLP
ncbi:MAG TPA: AAA family ATPase [Dehalococcoidia bacterium]|jgi:chloramphenicol 3-O-phosphotransferase|nr:AAA family ATPase [Dehalococcoidia bacterium]